MSKRATQLQERIIDLSARIETEKAGDKCQTYIEDLELDISRCKTQLNNVIRNPALGNDYSMVN